MINLTTDLRDIIIDLLERTPSLRDNDNRLISNVWFYQIGKENVEKLSASDLLGVIAKGDLASSESIRRTRQKLQQEHEKLRGVLYNKRHGNQKRIINQINRVA